MTDERLGSSTKSIRCTRLGARRVMLMGREAGASAGPAVAGLRELCARRNRTGRDRHLGQRRRRGKRCALAQPAHLRDQGLPFGLEPGSFGLELVACARQLGHAPLFLPARLGRLGQASLFASPTGHRAGEALLLAATLAFEHRPAFVLAAPRRHRLLELQPTPAGRFGGCLALGLGRGQLRAGVVLGGLADAGLLGQPGQTGRGRPHGLLAMVEINRCLLERGVPLAHQLLGHRQASPLLLLGRQLGIELLTLLLELLGRRPRCSNPRVLLAFHLVHPLAELFGLTLGPLHLGLGASQGPLARGKLGAQGLQRPPLLGQPGLLGGGALRGLPRPRGFGAGPRYLRFELLSLFDLSLAQAFLGIFLSGHRPGQRCFGRGSLLLGHLLGRGCCGPGPVDLAPHPLRFRTLHLQTSSGLRGRLFRSGRLLAFLLESPSLLHQLAGEVACLPPGPLRLCLVRGLQPGLFGLCLAGLGLQPGSFRLCQASLGLQPGFFRLARRVSVCKLAFSASARRVSVCSLALSASAWRVSVCNLAFSASTWRVSACNLALAASTWRVSACTLALSASAWRVSACTLAFSTSAWRVSACTLAFSTSLALGVTSRRLTAAGGCSCGRTRTVMRVGLLSTS